jgi:drug/metabolite transporter (DMT)-like permease
MAVSSFSLAICAVCPYVYCVKKTSLLFFFRYEWAGKLGIQRACLYCILIIYMLAALNILWIIGLDNISASTSNAVYQLQTGVTIALSVWVLGDRFVAGSQGLGMLLSISGVGLVVGPPLFEDRHRVKEGNPILGIGATLGSALFWGVYQVCWRVWTESRNKGETTRLEGLIDTLATLSVMGLCNFFLAWPTLVILDWTGFEIFTMPTEWIVLFANSLLSLLFNICCATAILLTSPVVVSIVAPLTIPISFVWDHLLYNSPLNVGVLAWIGCVLIMMGATLLEAKGEEQHHTEHSGETDSNLFEHDVGQSCRYNTAIKLDVELD